jgi:signal transduction histidine kinase/DNA-binding response OmpR family regulator
MRLKDINISEFSAAFNRMADAIQKVALKLVGGFVIVAFIVLVVGYFGLNGASRLGEAITQIAEVNLPSIETILIVSEAQTAVDAAENALLASNQDAAGRKAAYDRFDAAFKRAADARKIYEPLPQSKEEAAVWAKFVPAWDAWIKDHDTFITLAREYEKAQNSGAEDTSQEYEAMSTQALVTNGISFTAAETLLNQLIEANNVSAVEAAAGAKAAVGQVTTIALIGMIAGFIFALLLGIVLAMGITRPLSKMAEVVQTEMQINENAAQLADSMLRAEEVHTFCRELLEALLKSTGSQIGAVYLLNPQKTAFEHFESIGLGAGGGAAFSASGLEGELGAALATRQIQRITDIPADTRFTFAAVSGEFRPREILTIPVLSDHEVTAVISLANLRAYDAPSIRLVNDIWNVLSARLIGVLAFRKIKDLAERLEHQNSELDAQKRELTVQADELTEQNTELELQKRQVDETNRLKSAFLANMSHELRTPLHSVIALSGVLSRRLARTLPAEEQGYLEIIERNGNNLLALINDILDLSRIEAGREEISVSRFSVRELAGEIVAMLEPQALEKKIALRNQVSGDLPPITSDLAKWRHILQNLVGNAVKFTEQGQVTITAESAPGAIRISVTDTGIGIAADEFPHIFDEFRQGDDSISRKYGGTGLGLAIAKKYALLLGGGITMESVPGKGSTFTLHLPLALEAEIARASMERATGPAVFPSGQGQTILLIEDNEPAIIQLTDILQSEGYRLQVARSGKDALAQIEQKTLPEAVILDLMMPEVDGFQVLKAIRGAERTAHLPVLILTAKHVTNTELSFLKGNHIQQLIQKGDINRTGLLAAVAQMVAPRQEEPTPLPPLRRRPARPGKPVVLVVEDNPDNLLTAKALLNDRFQVIEATDGQAGVEQARHHRPDLILMDIGLPVMDGVQALQEIRKDETLRHIPVIAVTATAMKGERETILAHGFDGYISKPIDAELLKKTLREALG